MSAEKDVPEEKISVEDYVYEHMEGFIKDIRDILGETRNMLGAFKKAISDSNKALDVIEEDVNNRQKNIKQDLKKD